MAVTRAMLEGMGLTEAQASAVIEAHTETLESIKKERDQYKAEAGKLEGVQKQLSELKANTVDKVDYDALQKKFDDYKAEINGKETLTSKQEAYRALLTAENIPAKYHDRIVRMTDFDGMELNGDKLNDESTVRKAIKADWGEFVATPETKGAAVETPHANQPKTITRADIYAKDERGRYIMSTEERQRALSEHPELLKG